MIIETHTYSNIEISTMNIWNGKLTPVLYLVICLGVYTRDHRLQIGGGSPPAI